VIFSKYFFPAAHRDLIWQLARREVLSRYRGSLLGIGWSLVTPLLMLVVYTFVFVGVFKARWPGAEQAGGHVFAMYLFAGLSVFNLFSDVAGRSPRLVVEQPNLVTKVVFPLEVLAWVSVLAGLFHWVISWVILIVGAGLIMGTVHGTAFFAPLALLPFLPFLLGMSWLFSALGVYLRDMSQLMSLLVSLSLFLSPVFYSSTSLTPVMQDVLHANPLTAVIENLRWMVLEGEWPQWRAMGLYVLVAGLFACAAAWFFEKSRAGFADVL
jgi:lipopolysaccharide transport system permease protein